MTLDPQMKVFVDHLAAAGVLPDFAASGPTAAKESAAYAGAMMGTGPAVAREEDFMIDGAGAQLRARLYSPEARPLALLIFLHGGGWVVGTLEGYDAVLRRFANAAQVAILSIDYRLAPEFPFPTPVEDCFAALRWADTNRAALGIPEGLPLAIGGDSAGGNLSAVVSHLARDRGGPSLALQMLIYPATDCDFSTGSYSRFTEGLPLTTATMQWFWDQYLPDHAARGNPLASPLRAESLANLPPTLLVLAGYDPLRSEGEAYGEKLMEAGVKVTTLAWEGLTHGFFQFAEILGSAGDACDKIAAEFQGMLRQG